MNPKLSRILILILFLFSPTLSFAKEVFSVKYLSAEHVYINGGESDGISIGARLSVLGELGEKAQLEVVFVSANSASCVIIGDAKSIQQGDRVQLIAVTPLETQNRVTPFSSDSIETKPSVSGSSSTPFRRASNTALRKVPLSGSISFGAYQWNDQAASNLDFTQATTRVSLKARRLWGREITLSVRGRGRFDKRVREYRADVSSDDWENRLWELSLSYEEPKSPVFLYAGRLFPKGAASVGFLDGGLVQGRFSKSSKLSFFGGVAPTFLYNDAALSLTKYGGYVSVTAGSPQRASLEQHVGLVMEMHAGETNRQFLFSQGRINQAAHWGLSHALELDFNSGWRKEKAGQSVTFSNLYLTTWIRFASFYRVTLSYDNRINYWTFLNRSTVDSLFDDNLRQGIRLQHELHFARRSVASFSTSYRKEEGKEDPTWSYAGYIRKGALFLQQLDLSIQLALFDGPTTQGTTGGVRADYQVSSSLRFSSGYQIYSYLYSSVVGERENSSIEFDGQLDLSRHTWFSSHVQLHSGDDSKGTRIQTEFGYRL